MQKDIRVLTEFDIVLPDGRLNSMLNTVIRRSVRPRFMELVSTFNKYGIAKNWRGESGEYNVITSKGGFRCTRDDLTTVPKGFRVIVGNLLSGSDVIKTENKKVFTRLFIADPKTVCSASYLSIGSFEFREEAENCCKYLKTRFVRTLVGCRAVGININRNAYAWVPNQDFTSESKIDWTRSVAEIDKQLYRMYNLNEEEIGYIENTMQAIE